MSKEPFKVTVKDELELNIQKYEKLSAVIEQKKKNIEEVIDYGTQVLSRTYYVNYNQLTPTLSGLRDRYLWLKYFKND